MAKKPANATPSKSTSSATSTIPPSTKPDSTTTTTSTPVKPTLKSLSHKSSPQEIVVHVWNRYVNETPSRTLLLDVFLLFLLLVGGVQFAYCVVAGNFPFNAFLSGFCSAVGQFVLTVSLRMQTTELPPFTSTTSTSGTATAKKVPTKTIDTVTGEIVEEGTSRISSERAFADFVFGSLILHAFCINFIN